MNAAVPIQIISELVDSQRYGVEYQPLLEVSTGNVFAYEALARFYDAQQRLVSPVDVFQQLHHSPMMLARVEFALKQLQLTHRPEDTPLFINLDPDAWQGYGCTGMDNPLFSLIAESDAVVVELIENTSINDAQASADLCEALRKQGKQLALDDVGAPGSMVSLPILMDVDYIKFDRSWLYCQGDSNSVHLLSALVGYAKQTGKKTVLEGVEQPEHLALAQQLGMDLVQGYLFREQFRVIQPRTSLSVTN